ncbi:MAG: hypothetical protein EOO40_07330, partial [Deltaproteobacteria bacterium]
MMEYIPQTPAPMTMRTRCAHCDAEYFLGDGRLPPAGLSLQCSRCGNTFGVIPLTEPRPEAPPVAAVPAPQMLLRQLSGAIYDAGDAETLRRWIQEGRVHRGDLLSQQGGPFAPIGELPAWTSLFEPAPLAPVRLEAAPVAPVQLMLAAPLDLDTAPSAPPEALAPAAEAAPTPLRRRGGAGGLWLLAALLIAGIGLGVLRPQAARAAWALATHARQSNLAAAQVVLGYEALETDSQASMQAAQAAFEGAARVDPGFSDAYAGQADSHLAQVELLLMQADDLAHDAAAAGLAAEARTAVLAQRSALQG